MIAKGLSVSDMVSRVLVDLSDPSQRRWSSEQVVKFVNEGLRELADNGVFVRQDIIVGAKGVSSYEPFAEVSRIVGVWYDSRPLSPATDESMGALKADWRAATGEPGWFLASHNWVRLVPAPREDGEEIIFDRDPPITEDQGARINGDGYMSALNGGSVTHFAAGDATSKNALTARKNLIVEYWYFPKPSTADDVVPLRYVDALVNYALYRCFTLSQAGEEVARASLYLARWEEQKKAVTQGAQKAAKSDALLFSPFVAG